MQECHLVDKRWTPLWREEDKYDGPELVSNIIHKYKILLNYVNIDFRPSLNYVKWKQKQKF